MQWIISDIHGCIFTLETLLKKVENVDPEAKFVFVGDYVDRGKNSSDVLNFLINFKSDSVFLRGNHDDIVCWLLTDTSRGNIKELIRGPLTCSNVAAWWLFNGFETTLKSYEVNLLNENLNFTINKFRDIVPESHKNFLINLKMIWCNDTHFSCHASWPFKLKLPTSEFNISGDYILEMLWTRVSANSFVPDSKEYYESDEWDKICVFGHTPLITYNSQTPIKHRKLRLIDGGAFKGQYLTAYCCELDDWILESANKKDLV